MIAADNADRIRGIGRQLNALALADGLDAEDLGQVFAVIRSQLDTAERLAVENLRSQGVSWARIGAAKGMTRQAAQQRWGSASALAP